MKKLKIELEKSRTKLKEHLFNNKALKKEPDYRKRLVNIIKEINEFEDDIIINFEIKFRAWDKKRKKMMIVHTWSNLTLVVIDWSEKNYQKPDKNPQTEIDNWKEKGITLMQYTGLKDKNGKEIYEGDIVKDTLIGGYGVVKWGKCKNMVVNNEYDIDYYGIYIDFIKPSFPVNIGERVTPLTEGYIEIIGNIYENPELKTN